MFLIIATSSKSDSLLQEFGLKQQISWFSDAPNHFFLHLSSSPEKESIATPKTSEKSDIYNLVKSLLHLGLQKQVFFRRVKISPKKIEIL